MSLAFFDTNVFVYEWDAADPRKQRVARELVREALRTQRACISTQVVQECLNVLLHKGRVTLPPDAVQLYLEAVLAPLVRVGASVPLYQHALALRSRWALSFYDALIVAAALAAGCDRLLTEDLQHGQRIETLVVENPFVS